MPTVVPYYDSLYRQMLITHGRGLPKKRWLGCVEDVLDEFVIEGIRPRSCSIGRFSTIRIFKRACSTTFLDRFLAGPIRVTSLRYQGKAPRLSTPTTVPHRDRISDPTTVRPERPLVGRAQRGAASGIRLFFNIETNRHR